MERKTATREPIKHFRKIERLLTAIYCPKEVAVMHCKEHSRDGNKVAASNLLADSSLLNALHTDAFDMNRSCGTGKTTIY